MFLHQQGHQTGNVDGERVEQSYTNEHRAPHGIQDHEHGPKEPAARPTVAQETSKLLSILESIRRTDLTLEKIQKSVDLLREKLHLNKERTATDGSENNARVPKTDEPNTTYEGFLAGISEEDKVMAEKSGTAAQRRRGR